MGIMLFNIAIEEIFIILVIILEQLDYLDDSLKYYVLYLWTLSESHYLE